MLNLVILWINARSTMMRLSNHIYPPWKHDNRILMDTLTSWCLIKCGIFIKFRKVDLVMSIVHGWGMIFDLFPFLLVKYL
jgi:hypothetical protein